MGMDRLDYGGCMLSNSWWAATGPGVVRRNIERQEGGVSIH